MGNTHSELVARADEYCRICALTIERQLGAGFDGLVLSTTQRSAIKVFRHGSLYLNELAVYQRLQDLGVDDVEGFAVPGLLAHHNDLLIIEMETVKPPFVVDFAGAYLDTKPPFPDEIWEEWESDRAELFG